MAQAPDPPAAPVAHARWFRVLADPTRLAILQHLLTGPHSVTELVERTGLPRSRVSNHLACLRWCRFAHAEQQGRRVVYTIADPRLGQLLDLAGDLAAGNAEHLATCHRIGPDWM
jgi:DNA-binding transcriptional ArsR family regulator